MENKMHAPIHGKINKSRVQERGVVGDERINT